jgi:hypothetical protein
LHESEQDMAQDTFNLLKTLVSKIRGALTLAPAPAPRPQLAGKARLRGRRHQEPD